MNERKIVIEWMFDVMEVAEDARVRAWDDTCLINYLAAKNVLRDMGALTPHVGRMG